MLVMFVMLVLGAIDFSRWLYAIDAANEAARNGVRTAVVCDKSDTAIQQRTAYGLVGSTGGTITVTYTPGGCYANAAAGTPVCTGVSVQVAGYTVPKVAWFLPTLTVPTITTYMPRESMSSTNNARCD